MIGASGRTGQRCEIVNTARNTRNIERHVDLVQALDGFVKAKNDLPYFAYGSYFRQHGAKEYTYLMKDGSIVVLSHVVHLWHYETEIGRWLNKNAKGWYAHDSHKHPGSHYVYFESANDAIFFKLRWY